MSVTQWVVELSNGTDDPDYYGPFPDIGAARAWRNDREWARERECVFIDVFPPDAGEDDYNLIIPLTR
jgi:hypothetical protein